MTKENDMLTRIFDRKDHDEEGAALASVVILGMVMFIILASLSMTLATSVRLTADYRSSVTALAAAESGVDSAVYDLTTNRCDTTTVHGENFTYEVYRSAAVDAPLSIDDASVFVGCPQDGDRYFIVRSIGTDTYGASLEVIATYMWVNAVTGSNDGALLSGGVLEVSTMRVNGDDASLVLLDGDLNCNTSTRIAGDVVVLSGAVNIANACFIDGSLYASGDVKIQNPAVAVLGSVYTEGNFFLASGSTVNGSVTARGNVTLSSGSAVNGGVVAVGSDQATIDDVSIGLSLHTNGPLRIQNGSVIGGDLTSSSGSADIYDSTVHGSVHVAGSFTQFGASSVGGDVTASGTGTSNIAPSTSIGGDLTLGGLLSTWGAGPTVGGTISTQTVTTAPQALYGSIPEELQPESYRWVDYEYEGMDWAANGYERVSLTSCNFRNDPSLIQRVQAANAPTVFDLRGCSSTTMTNVTFNIQADIAFIVNSLEAQGLIVNSADQEAHQFTIISPDQVLDGEPTCSSGQGQFNLYGLVMSTEISGYMYSPCAVRFGGGSTINGQLVSGHATYQGGQQLTINYVKTGIPGFPVIDGEDADRFGFRDDAHARAMPKLIARSEP